MPTFSRDPDSDMEIVEDSEPERVRIRSQGRKSASNAREPQINISASRMHQCSNIDSHTTATVIEISDSESSTSSCGQNLITHGSVFIAAQPVTQQGSSKATIDLKKFAFKPLSTEKQVRSDEISIALQPSEAQPPERRRVQKKVHMNLDSLSSDVAQISRCVCCSISWTARKTAVQKLEHIQRCAKKHGYNDETVRILIQNEIASSKEPNADICRVPITHSTCTTLLEDVVQPRLNRRNVVYPSSHISVGSPLRVAILARANEIIVGPSPDEASPQPSAGRKLVSDFPIIQAFTASSLIEGSSKPSLFSATSQDDEHLPELPNEMLDTMSARVRPPASNASTIDIGTPTHSAKAIGDGFGQGDCRKNVNKHRDLLQVTLKKGPVHKSKNKTPQPSEKGIHSDIGTLLNEDTAPAKRVRPQAYSSKKKKTIFGKDWETFMKERIREDNELNLRIIRYEPVDLSLFLKLAKAYAPSTSEGTLKLHLRNFLDNQAIHFYDGNTWKR